MILLIDNYDSFVFNLAQYLGELGQQIRVVRNDAIRAVDILSLRPDGIVISPGPGRPEDAGISVEAVRQSGGRFPVLGVCLGHQAIGAAYGGLVTRAPCIMHGKASDIFHDGCSIYSGLPNPFRAGRYHSLLVSPENLPDCLAISAWTSDGLIMGLRHRRFLVEGVQFHPESILTEGGRQLIRNFVSATAAASGNRDQVQTGGTTQDGR